MPIDDTKKCICKPALSGKNHKCKRCHPKAAVAHQAPHKNIKPAQVKKHKALPTGQLPWLSASPTIEVETDKFDPYADLEELIK